MKKKKNFAERLNAIGKEFGYPFVMSKTGRAFRFDPSMDYTKVEDLALVVYCPVDEDIFDIPKTENGTAFKDLIPFGIICKSTVLNDKEAKQFILRGKRSEIALYFQTHEITPRLANLVVLRNDDELFFKLLSKSMKMPASLEYAMVSMMEDGVFIDLLPRLHASGMKCFSPKSQQYLAGRASFAKFEVFVREYGLCPSAQKVVVQKNDNKKLNCYLAKHRLDSEAEVLLGDIINLKNAGVFPE